jgi:excisionase family DNA binding protein
VIPRDERPIAATTAARVLGVHPQTARRWIASGDLAGRRIGRSWYTSRAAIRALVSSLTRKTA